MIPHIECCALAPTRDSLTENLMNPLVHGSTHCATATDSHAYMLGIIAALITRNAEMRAAYLFGRLVLVVIVTKIPISSLVAICNHSILSPSIPQASRQSSIQSCDSSASCKAPSIF